MKSLWHKIVLIGVDETVDFSEIKYITLLNQLALIAFLINLGILPILTKHLPESKIFLFFLAIGNPLCLVVLLLNYYKFRLAARIFFNMLGASAYISVSILGGRELDYHYHLISVIIAAFFIYPPSQKRFMFAVILITLISFVGLEAWFLKHNGLMSVSNGFLKEASFSLNMILIAYIAGFIFYIHTIYLRAEKLSESLLHNILPVKIANRLKLKQQTIADSFRSCSVLFVDIVGFTTFSEKMPPEKLVALLNQIFTELDNLADKYGLEKIKTIGDAYMIVAGVPEYRVDHAEAVGEFALETTKVINMVARQTGINLQLRIGINSGPVVAGVIGKRKFSYDLWGDTVNTASRMESHGVPGKIQVSQNTYDLLKGKYIFEERGKIEIKGKDTLPVYFLKGRKLS